MSTFELYQHHLQVCTQCRVRPPFRLCARGCELLRAELLEQAPEQLDALEGAIDLMQEAGRCEKSQRLVAKGALGAALALTLGNGVPSWVFLSEMGIVAGLLFGHYYRRTTMDIEPELAQEFRADLTAWTEAMTAIACSVRVRATLTAPPAAVH
jgi:hypothetical protein